MPKLYQTPAGYEAETPFGLFKTTAKIKDRAMKELMKFLEECAEESEQEGSMA